LQPQTTGVLGYQFRTTSYTADEQIGFTLVPTPKIFHSDDRNSRVHYVYVGAQHSFTPELTAVANVGINYVDYYNDPNGTGNGYGPYAKVNVQWTYATDSYVEGGVQHDLNATDAFSAN